MTSTRMEVALGIAGPPGSPSPEGFGIQLWEVGVFGTSLLAAGLTGAQGRCILDYRSAFLDRKFMLKAMTWSGRVIFELEAKESEFIDGALQFNGLVPIVVHVDDIAGWSVRTTRAATSGLTFGNKATIYADNHTAWNALTDDIQRATTSVSMSQLHFESTLLFTKFLPEPPVPGSPTTGTKLADAMVATAARGVSVRIVMNEFAVQRANGTAALPYPINTTMFVRFSFRNTPVEVRAFNRGLPEGPMHAKLASIDRKIAYSLGSPLMQEYFDAGEHRINDARRGEMKPLFNAIRRPVHDVSMKLEGPVVESLSTVLDWLWTRTAPTHPPAPQNRNSTAMQVVLSMPPNGSNPEQENITEIFEAYLRAIEHAENYIYLENQYFTELLIVDALIAAMRRKPSLQLILLLNQKVDLPLYGRFYNFHPGWQPRAIDRLLKGLEEFRDRFGIFVLWSQEPSSPKSQMIRNYVHSKVAIIDDKWATVGSANLDGVSLVTSQYVLREPDNGGLGSMFPSMKTMHAIEANVVCYNGVDDMPASDTPALLRRTLWAEHLALDGPGDGKLFTPPANGWLGLWHQIAQRRTAALNSTPVVWDHARILQCGTLGWADRTFATAAGKRLYRTLENTYLAEAGVNHTLHDVQDETHSFDFRTGQWY